MAAYRDICRGGSSDASSACQAMPWGTKPSFLACLPGYRLASRARREYRLCAPLQMSHHVPFPFLSYYVCVPCATLGEHPRRSNYRTPLYLNSLSFSIRTRNLFIASHNSVRCCFVSRTCIILRPLGPALSAGLVDRKRLAALVYRLMLVLLIRSHIWE